jgi:hypothetical protein
MLQACLRRRGRAFRSSLLGTTILAGLALPAQAQQTIVLPEIVNIAAHPPDRAGEFRQRAVPPAERIIQQPYARRRILEATPGLIVTQHSGGKPTSTTCAASISITAPISPSRSMACR